MLKYKVGESVLLNDSYFTNKVCTVVDILFDSNYLYLVTSISMIRYPARDSELSPLTKLHKLLLDIE